MQNASLSEFETRHVELGKTCANSLQENRRLRQTYKA